MPPTFASFGGGSVPTIHCVNQAKTPLGVDFSVLVAAMKKFVAQFLAPAWGCPAIVKEDTSVPASGWGLIFLDDADQAGALGYHELTPAGMPQGKVFVKTTLDDGGSVSVTATHELAEMLVDPGVQMVATGYPGRGAIGCAYEVGDAVEESSFKVDGVDCTNFVYPSWFEGWHKAGSGVKFDELGLCTKPFQLLRGGYIGVLTRTGWKQVFGSHAAAMRFGRRKGDQSRPLRRAGASAPPQGPATWGDWLRSKAFWAAIGMAAVSFLSAIDGQGSAAVAALTGVLIALHLIPAKPAPATAE